MTIWNDNSDRFASRDRDAAAQLVLNTASADADATLERGCREAIGIFRIGRTHEDPWASRDAALTLAAAQTTAMATLVSAKARADRILGKRRAS